MPFPSPPWRLCGDLWLSVFAVLPGSGTPDHPPGLYGAGFADYTEPGVLAYRELVAARLVRDGPIPRVQVTDIWVDSEASRDGGRALWAMPKELAELHLRDRRVGPAARTSWNAHVEGRPIAAAMFSGPATGWVRAPFAFTTAQPRPDGSTVVAKVSGTARTVPALGTWRFGTDGPLAWLHGHRPVGSFRISDFRLTFGG